MIRRRWPQLANVLMYSADLPAQRDALARQLGTHRKAGRAVTAPTRPGVPQNRQVLLRGIRARGARWLRTRAGRAAPARRRQARRRVARDSSGTWAFARAWPST